MRVHCLLNARAGSGEEARDAVEGAFAACGGAELDLVIEVCHEPDGLLDRARRALAGKPDVLAAGGGDGTLSAVASVLVGGPTALGILPLGTLNHFARDAGIPLDLGAAAGVIRRGRVRSVDVAEVNGQLFLNNSSVGVYADVVRMRERLRPRLGKWPAMAVAALAKLWRYPVVRVDIEADGERVRRRVPLVFVGNNAYTLAWPEAGRRERLDEGFLTLVLLRDAGIRGLARSTLHLLRGNDHLAKDIEVRRAETVRVHARGASVRVALDGEVTRMAPPLEYHIRKAALRVCVAA